MDVVFRTDSSHEIGSGHLRRCLVLAEELRGRGAEVVFHVKDLAGNLNSMITQHGFQALLLPKKVEEGELFSWKQDALDNQALLWNRQKPDWLVIDHYGIDYRWEAAMRKVVGRIFVIDDLANRHHDCEVILDQNYCHDPESRYMPLTPNSCVRLIGPHYVLLRKDFLNVKKKLGTRRKHVRRVLVFFGGTDPTNETLKALQGIATAPGALKLNLDVVVGATHPHLQALRKSLNPFPLGTLHVQTEKMADLMAAADLYIGSGGSSTWERCFLGLPALVVAVVDNQVEVTKTLGEKGVHVYLGKASELKANDYRDRLMEYSTKYTLLLEQLIKSDFDCIDGLGAFRVGSVFFDKRS